MTQVIGQIAPQSAESLSRGLAQARVRLPGIDRLRGLVILLMALDHVRDFFNADALRFDPVDLTQTYPLLFLTRFITHYCAPTFVLLAGVSAFLHGMKLDGRAALARFLVTRGAWLILLDAVVISPVWAVELGRFHLGTLWAIGASMIALAGLIFLGPRVALVTGAFILLSHNLLDPLHSARFGEWAPFWNLLHEPGSLPFGLPGKVMYPVLPWAGVMALGYGLGPIFLDPAAGRARQLTRLGLAMILLFVLLRATNLYGDPHPWSAQNSSVMTALSMLNVTKYPPSLLYALVTLGPAFLLLPAMEQLGGAAGEVLAVFGRVPLFIYVLHLYVAHAAAIALWLVEGFSVEQLRGFGVHGVPLDGLGLSLGSTYAAWILIMAALYVPCRWFASLKERRRDWWLSYL
jgi:uncharacterized membrane protein